MTELASPRATGVTRVTVATKPDDIINVTSHHTIPEEEKRRFVEYVNSVLREDADVKHLVPVDPTSMAFFEAAKDGILLIKLINSVVAGTVDMKKVHKGKNLTRFNIVENLNHVINGAKKIGVNLVNIGVVDLEEGKPHLVLGLVWQIVKIRLVNDMASKIAANDSATLRNLKNNPTEVLIAWVNDCLKKAGSNKQIKNLSSDIADSEAYVILLNHLAPKSCTKAPLDEKDTTKRAELMLQEADKLKLRKFVSPADVVDGNSKLNFAFVANIFASLKEISDADRAIVPAPAPVVQTRSETEHLETTIARLKKEIEELKSRLNNSEKSHAEISKLYNDKCVENQQLLDKLSQLEKALASKQNDELNNLKKAIDGASKEKEDLLKRIRELEAQLAALQSKFDALKKENGELVKSLDTAESEIKKLDATVVRLDKELDEKDENVRELLRQLLELKGRFDTNETRLKKYVYEEYTRNETVREKQGKSVNLTLKDCKVGAPMHGWLTIQSLADELTWKKRYFVLKDNHLFLYRTDKDNDNEGKTLHIIAGSKVQTVGDFIVKTREEIRKEKKKARKAKEKAEKEKGKKKKEKKEDKKEKKTPKNRLHHNVFTLASPDLGDLNPGLLFRFSAENEQDMESWARFMRNAVKALPDMDQVYYFVVPEAKAAAEAEKRRQTIAAPKQREHAQTSSALPRPEHHEHHEHHEQHKKDDDSDVISDSYSSSSSSSS